MGRHRGPQHDDLPANLYRAGVSQFRYNRPDTRKLIPLRGSLEHVIEVASTLNLAFDAGQFVKRAFHASRIKAFDWATVPDRMLCSIHAHAPDIIPAAFKKLRTDLWPAPSKYSKSETVTLIGSDFDPDCLPSWIINLAKQSEKSAAKRKIPYALTNGDIAAMFAKAAGQCTVTGMNLRIDSGHKKFARRPWMPSIDRIDSEGGYTAGNCRIVCVAANIAMGQWGEGVLIEMAKSMARKSDF